MIPIPDSIEEVTADWLTAVLQHAGAIDCRVSTVESTHFGEGVGLLSFMLRCRLHYDAPHGDEPASVIIKLEPEGERYRESVEYSRGFEREIRFYRDLAPQTPIRVPRFFYGDYDKHRAVIVLEDVGHLTSRNQIHGLQNSETVAAARQIARLHAKYWNNDTHEALSWMPVHDERLTMNYAECWDLFEDVYGLRIGKDAVAMGRRLRDAIDWLRAEMTARPRTVCHGDFRADNMFFSGDGEDVVVIDWQLSTRSLGALDVARLLGGSEPPIERSSHHMETFNVWYQTLRDEGVAEYSQETALQDFRLGALIVLSVPVRITTLWGPDPGGRQGQLMDAIATRMFASAMEIDAAARLP